MAKQERERETRGLVPWRPFTEMTRWEREMERMFGDFFGRRLHPFWDERWWPERGLGLSAPAVDLYEEKDEIVAKAELPGMEKDDIQVNITDRLLTITGEKKKEEEIKQENYYHSERAYGSFSRSLELPAEVRVEKAQASFKNGVLEIRLPKTEEAKKKEIKVKVQ
ncbi:MAG: Hsp20/alpha crystallin family protein [Deltaproteobacteria bacterium]|nr:Hsp20/alpha crystallin family protein [Deltaproteobacteria bacterium]